MKLDFFSGKILDKFSNIKLHEIPSRGSEVLRADGRTDGHDEANSHFPESCHRTWNSISCAQEPTKTEIQ